MNVKYDFSLLETLHIREINHSKTQGIANSFAKEKNIFSPLLIFTHPDDNCPLIIKY